MYAITNRLVARYDRETGERVDASISGGVWRDCDLFVTDHDNERLYRLRLPDRGDVLEYVGQQFAPFTGQGIAHDPVSGGLVGINRAKSLIVFAEPPAE